MNTDELLVHLDFDETNVTHHHSQSQSQQQQHQHNHHNSIDITLPTPTTPTNRIHLQRPTSPVRNTSEPILPSIVPSAAVTATQPSHHDAFSTLLTSNSTVPRPQILDQITAAQHHQHRRAFSDDTALAASLTQTIQLQPYQQTHSQLIAKPTESNHSLINLSNSPALINGDVEDQDDDDDFTQQHLEPTTEIISSIVTNGDCGHQQQIPSHLSGDDTVEVSLLADLSMDSRESQPLLGIGRDTHDFVYNNFPGKRIA